LSASLSLPAINKDAAVMPRNSLLLTPGSWFASILSFAGDCSEEPKRNCFESLLLGVMASPPVQLQQRALSANAIVLDHQIAAPFPLLVSLSCHQGATI